MGLEHLLGYQREGSRTASPVRRVAQAQGHIHVANGEISDLRLPAAAVHLRTCHRRAPDTPYRQIAQVSTCMLPRRFEDLDRDDLHDNAHYWREVRLMPRPHTSMHPLQGWDAHGTRAVSIREAAPPRVGTVAAAAACASRAGLPFNTAQFTAWPPRDVRGNGSSAPSMICLCNCRRGRRRRGRLRGWRGPTRARRAPDSPSNRRRTTFRARVRARHPHAMQSPRAPHQRRCPPEPDPA